jgi:hypothetical protein
VVAGGDMSVVSLALLAGLHHVRGEHDHALTTATEVVDRSGSYAQSGLWAWALYVSLPYALELGQHGRHAEALDFLRDRLEDNAVPSTPGVMTSVVLALGALALLRGDRAVGGVLLDYTGQAMLSTGIRTPVDIALYSHYVQQLGQVDAETARRNRELAGRMSVTEAIDLGLRCG